MTEDHHSSRWPRGSARHRWYSIYGRHCYKCGSRWKLSFLRLYPRVCEPEDDTISDLMLLCGGCLDDVRARWEKQLPEDRSPNGGYAHGAAWNCLPHRYPENHPARKNRARVTMNEHDMSPKKKAPKRKRKDKLDGISRVFG